MSCYLFIWLSNSNTICKNNSRLYSCLFKIFVLSVFFLPLETSAEIWTNEEENAIEGAIPQAVPVTFYHCARITSITTFHTDSNQNIPELSIVGPNMDDARSFPGNANESLDDSIVSWTFHPSLYDYWDYPLVLMPGTYYFNISNNSQWIATEEPDNFGKIQIEFDDRVCSSDYLKVANTSPFYSPGDILSDGEPWTDRGVMVIEVNPKDQSYSLINVIKIEYMLDHDNMDGAVGRESWVLSHEDNLSPFRLSWNGTEETYVGLISQQTGLGESNSSPSGITPDDILLRYKDFEYPPTIQ